MRAADAPPPPASPRRSGERLLSGAGAPPAGIGGAGAALGSGGGSTAAYEARMQAMDRMSIGASDALTDTTTVYDAWNGHDVAVDGSGDVWQNDDTGEIFTTPPDSYYDPSADGILATQLAPAFEGADPNWIGSGITD